MENNNHPFIDDEGFYHYPIMSRVNKPIPESELHKLIINVFNSMPIDNKNIVFGTGCLTYGFVMVSKENLNICDNPECKNCRYREKLIKESFKEEINKLGLKEQKEFREKQDDELWYGK